MSLAGEARAAAGPLLNGRGWLSGRTVGLVAAGTWASKTWPAGHAALLARELMAAGRPVLLLGGPGEEGVAATMARLAPGIRLLPPCDVGTLGAVIERLGAVVGTDSGPRHLAAALGRPTFAWFGPTHPDTWNPAGSGTAPGGRTCPAGAATARAARTGVACRRSSRRRRPGWCWNTWRAMDARLPISVLLLARDETRRIEALVPALGFAREVVVVWDPRGSEETRAAAERLGARVFVREFEGFGPQRQFALAQCREPWVLWIDADEWLDETAVAALARLGGLPAVPEDGFALERRTHFLGRRIRFCGWRGETVLRIFRRASGRFDDAPVHERVRIEGRTGRLAGRIEHDSYATEAECARKLREYARAGALEAFAAGRTAAWWDRGLRPLLRFLRMYVFQFRVPRRRGGPAVVRAGGGPGAAQVRHPAGAVPPQPPASGHGAERAVKVCFFGAWDPAYPRNRVLREGLRQAGAEVLEARVSERRAFRRYPALVAAFARGARSADTLLVPEFRHKDMPLARALAGRRLLWTKE